MGDKDPYPTLLGIDLDFENYAIIDLKKEMTTFEVEEVRVMHPLDPSQGPRFTNPIDDREEPELYQIYQLTAGRRDDYINLTTGGSIR